MKGLLVAALGAFALFPAVAAETAPVKDDDKVVCKREKELGSNRAGRKVCMTGKEWRQQQDSTQRTLREFDSRSGTEFTLPKGRGG